MPSSACKKIINYIINQYILIYIIYCLILIHLILCFYFYLYTTTTIHIYTLSLHDALPILKEKICSWWNEHFRTFLFYTLRYGSHLNTLSSPDRMSLLRHDCIIRSEEHTSELQSRGHIVCRLLLVKK